MNEPTRTRLADDLVEMLKFARGRPDREKADFIAERVMAFFAENSDADAIVRALAGSDPVYDMDPEYGCFVCINCPDDYYENLGRPFGSAEDVEHSERCVWRRARAWVEAHPVPTGAE